MSIRYPDPQNEDAEIILANCVAWRRYADGREEDLTEEEEEARFQRLHAELEADEARRERGRSGTT
jgi:hypothetical protein